MTEIFNNPDLQNAIKSGMTKHEIDMAIGECMRKNYPKPLESFPDSPRQRIKECLIATCSTEKEAKEVLNNSGFSVCAVSIMEEPKTEKDREVLALCLAIGGAITKNGLPCMIMEW